MGIRGGHVGIGVVDYDQPYTLVISDIQALQQDWKAMQAELKAGRKALSDEAKLNQSQEARLLRLERLMGERAER